jgi:hypothetical protein
MKAIKNYFKLTFKRLHTPAIMLNTLSPAEMGTLISGGANKSSQVNSYWWIETTN